MLAVPAAVHFLQSWRSDRGESAAEFCHRRVCEAALQLSRAWGTDSLWPCERELVATQCMVRLPFDSDGAKQLNKEIFEAIYFAALEESCALAERDGPYSSYAGSPASTGTKLEELRAAVMTEKDLEKKAAMLREIRELRGHGDLLNP